MKNLKSPDRSSAASESLASRLQAMPVAVGHFDELRGQLAGNADAVDAQMASPWQAFFASLANESAADMDQRCANLARQVLDNGITYNVYADENGPQRPWSLDLFPLIVGALDWQRIESGLLQRMELLEQVMHDVYGAQDLLHAGYLPPALVHGHPGYVRAMQGVKPVGGRYLHIAAFDLARSPDGNWWVEAQRCQAPSGLGYLLENRLAIAAQFPRAFQTLRVQRLAGTYRALMDSMKTMSPAGADAHLVLLTPGPYNETYFEHAYLARYLGLSLVQGSDLVVRDAHLFLKTLKGLVPVHGVLKRVDDQYLDPLELRADSTLGVPGLLQAIRAGNVLVANAPGSAFLESPALLGFLPALAQRLLGQELVLPALPTWWCGERSAMEQVLPCLGEYAIKSTYPGSPGHDSFDAVLGARLDARERDEWAGRILRQAEEYTVQAYAPLSQLPSWRAADTLQAGTLQARSVMLRVLVVSDGAQGWRVLPGGLARLASAGQEITSMQRGGSSADVWALTDGELDHGALLAPHLSPQTLMQRQRLVTSRAAENLYWLGRYTERAENAIRLARLTLESLQGEERGCEPLLVWLSQMAQANTLVLQGVPGAAQAPRVFERSLIDSLAGHNATTSVGYYLRALKLAGSSVRDRLSQEHWRIINRCEEAFFEACTEQRRRADFSVQQALQNLRNTSDHMAAITGAQTDRMTRDDGWRLLSIGRHIERLSFLSSTLLSSLQTRCLDTDGGFDALVELFDSAISFHAQFQQSHDMAALVSLLILDRDNPRSIAWVAHTLRGRLAKLAGSAPTELSALSLKVPDPNAWGLAQLCGSDEDATDGRYGLLADLLSQCQQASFQVSDEISLTYFTHSGLSNQSLGAA